MSALGNKIVISAPASAHRRTKSGGRTMARRRYGVAFWMDWAPMIVLGLVIALSGVYRIGTSLMAGNTATPQIVERARNPRATTTAEVPVQKPAAKPAVDAAS